MKNQISRRSAVTRLAAAGAFAATAASLSHRLLAADAAAPGLKGRVNHSVCKWCYPKVSLDELCRAGQQVSGRVMTR